MEQITMDKQYRYRNGEPARILCVDGSDKKYPVVSIDQKGQVWTISITGQYCMENIPHEYDLIEIIPWEPEDKEPVWAWDNGDIYRNLGFYDAVNKCLFYNDGWRNGVKCNNYTKIEHIEQWMLDMQAQLED